MGEAESMHRTADQVGDVAAQWASQDRFVSNRLFAATAQIRKAARHLEEVESDDS